MAEINAADLLSVARDAAKHAYAPYSHFPVGAALLSESGEIFTGVNVENVSYGLTLCAERSAIARAITEGHTRFRAIAVWAEKRPHGAVTPCGACRQVLSEFMDKNAPIICSDQSGQTVSLSLAVLLPAAFEGIDGN